MRQAAGPEGSPFWWPPAEREEGKGEDEDGGSEEGSEGEEAWEDGAAPPWAAWFHLRMLGLAEGLGLGLAAIVRAGVIRHL